MKRKILFVLLVIGIAAIASAQGQGQGQEPGRNQRSLPPAEAVTVSGSLIVANGMPAIKSGDVTYFVSGISRLAGFVDGLKEGALVTIEGMALTNPKDNTFKFLRSSKLTLNGKTYELAPPAGQRQWRGGQVPPRGSMRYPAPKFPHKAPRHDPRNAPHHGPHGRPYGRTL